MAESNEHQEIEAEAQGRNTGMVRSHKRNCVEEEII